MAGGEAAGTVFQIGSIHIAHPIVVTWGIMLTLALFSWAVARRFGREPGPLQAAVEGAVGAIDDTIRSVLPGHAERVFPFIATLWIFILLANLIGLIPGIHAPTGDLSVTAALAVLVFLSVHRFGIAIEGITPYLRHYLAPSPLLLPFHIISEISRTLTLAVRLFGNMMSLEMAALLVLLVAGFLVPIPLLMLHIVEALIQAYIFGMLALIYLAGAIQTRALHSPSEKG
ncbi:MAG: Sodium-transporting ATPase subunit B [Nitrospira sp.]|jgi:F-type H+-transporting ATPase subunit a|nr:Sodium-transporting ATPase subunit B [Nitrospira sp.]